MKYIVPEYYGKFACKGGSCRHTCCHGWRITLSRDEYFRLLGLDCTESLRRTLDVAFYVLEDASPDRYAAVKLRYDGDCSLHAPDGLCELHRTMGEGALPAVCRMYPRAERDHSAVCSSSCEAVVELLAALDAPLEFVTYDRPGKPCDGKAVDAFFEKRAVLADTTLPLRERIAKCVGVDKIADTPCFEEEYNIIRKMARVGSALDEYALPPLEAIYSNGETSARYADAAARLDEVFPKWELLFTNLLINHLFYTLDENDLGGERAALLCQTYAILRLTAVGTALLGGGMTEIFDSLAGVLRYIEHSGYFSAASRLQKACGITPPSLLAF